MPTSSSSRRARRTGRAPTRLDLAGTNVRSIRSLLPPLLEVAPDAIYLLVTNPVDVVTYIAQEISGLPHGRVIGSGTVLDTSRLRHLLAGRLAIGVNSVHASIVGEHGDSEIALWSSATVGGTPLLDVVGPDGGRITADELDGLLHDVRTAAAKIIGGKGNTNLAIGLATARIVRSISSDERGVLPVSVRTEIAGVGRGVPVAARAWSAAKACCRGCSCRSTTPRPPGCAPARWRSGR